MTAEGGQLPLRNISLRDSVETMDIVESSICEIVASIAGVRHVTPGQRLYHDLGLSGDDANEIFDAVSGQFGVRFSGLRFQDYFPDESEGFTDRLERMIGVAKPRKAITVGHLAAVAARGEWFEP